MSLKELFVRRNALHTNTPLIQLELDNLIDKQKRIPVRKDPLQRVDIEYDPLFFLVLVFFNDLLLLIEFPNDLGKFHIGCVSGTCGKDMRF